MPGRLDMLIIYYRYSTLVCSLPSRAMDQNLCVSGSLQTLVESMSVMMLLTLYLTVSTCHGSG